jgi:hypothetical protein
MPVYYPPSILSDIRVMDFFMLMREKSISTGQALQEYLHSVRRTHKKPVEGGLILSLFIAQMNFIKMLQERRQNLAILTG